MRHKKNKSQKRARSDEGVNGSEEEAMTGEGVVDEGLGVPPKSEGTRRRRLPYHINPKRVDIHSSVGVEELLELRVPVICHVRMKPVGERCNAWPHYSFIYRPIFSFEKNIFLDTIIEGRIVRIPYRRVDHDNIVLLVVMKGSNELPHLLQWKPTDIRQGSCHGKENKYLSGSSVKTFLPSI